MTTASISRFSVAGYKAFPRDTPALELAPVTLVIGHNNAGKSALVRAPVLLGDSLGDDGQLLSLNARGLDFAQSAEGIFHGGAAHANLEFGLDLRLAGRDLSLRVELGFLSARTGRGSLAVRSLSLEQTNGADLAGLPLVVRRTASTQNTAAFTASLAGIPALVDQPWDRLLHLPRWLLQALTTLPGFAETVGTLIELQRVGDAVHHLGPFRALPKRQYEVPEARPVISSDGAGAVELLAWDRRQGGRLLDHVSQWFTEQPHFGFSLRLDGSVERAGTCSLVLLGTSDVAVNLADAGSGVAQVLPLLIRRFEETTATSPTLQIIEQPELHLHPAACAALGDVFVDMALSGQTVLAETHSENLLLRVRRRVAEGKLQPEQVAIYWLENETGSSATVTRLPVLADGWVDDWPDGVFVEDAAEARALARAMRSGS